MVNNNYNRGILFSVLILSAVLAGMTMLTVVGIAEPNASNTTPPVTQTISINANPANVIVNTQTNINFIVTSAGSAVSGAIITLGGVATGSGTTDTNGQAVISVSATNPGTITATATKTGYTGASTSINASQPSLSVSANPANVIVNTQTNINFIVTSAGSAVSGAIITLGGVAAGSGTTDTNGNAAISVNATSPGTITATATKTGYTGASTSINASQPSLNISANPTTVTVNVSTNVNFTVTSAGAAVSGAIITLGGVATGSAITDTNGKALISVNATSPGIITATATKTGYTAANTPIKADQPSLKISTSLTTVTVNVSTNVNFTVTIAGAAVSGATVTLTGLATGSSTTDANGNATISVNASGPGTIIATATKIGYPSASFNMIAKIAADTTPPESITNLTMENNGTSWIKWNWTNPIVDFSYVAIWINNAWHNASVGANFFNTSVISYLLPGTEYTIATHTVDTSGNVNSTWVNLTSSTLPNTNTGSPVNVILNRSTISFANVTVGGNTLEIPDTSGHFLPSAYITVGNYLNISTTATYNGPVTVSIKYTPSSVPMGYSESDIRLYHWNSTGQWDNVTVSVDNVNDFINGQVMSLSPFVLAFPAKPSITKVSPTGTKVESTVNVAQTFNITVDQTASVIWNINSTLSNNSGIIPAGNISSITRTPSSIGNYNVTVIAANNNGTDMESWNWTVQPTTFFTGNRIWDGGKPIEFSTTYTWTPQSFSGFYYDAKDDVGSETIQIKSISRTISKNNIIYSTSPDEVSFANNSWGTYQVIGFMADKYFAGYKNHTISKPTNSFGEVSAIGQQQLHKVLMDDNTKRTISVGGTLALRDGYVLQASDIDLNGRTMFLRLLKDGTEVDSTPLGKDETFVYKKRVGSVDDLPLILVRFDNVFSGQELQAAFLKGIFQISEDVTEVKIGNQFGRMKVTEVNKDKIVMTNSDGDVGLNKGSIVDLMGDLKIIVADNDILRFALSVDRPGDLEVRSTVFSETDTNPITEWTPYNFGMNIGKTSVGFYYNLDDGLGNEKIIMTQRNGRIIPDNKLVYSTSPEQVSFTYDPFGKYQVIGFMADKYFAGYTGHTIPHPTNSFGDINALSQGELHKIIIDDDTKRTISVGGTIALKEGYVLQASDIDLNGRTMFLRLLKDGTEVDSSPLAKDETYVYKKRVGTVDDLPLILVRFDNVFSGQELQAAFLKGIFQLSETATTVKIGDQYGKMEVTTVAQNSITMSNNGDIGLDKNKNDVLMGNIRLKVADNDKLRFYFAVDVTADMIQNQLVIDAPTKAMAGDTIKIKVKAGTAVTDNATISIGTDTGTTDKDGILNYTLPRSLNGTYNITATKTGYEKATQNIEIDKYIDYRLSIEAPSQANQFETITIKVLFNGTAMSGASVIFDNTTIGTSDSNGEVTYKLETSGTHSISASKTSYITVARDIEIRAPYSEFKGLDINVTPNPGFVGEAFLARSNITNVGTKSDSLQVELIVNGTAVDNKTVVLGAGERVEVNFTRIEAIAGNVTVEIMGQSILYEAKEKPTNYLLIGAIVTGIGIIIIYILTSKGMIDLELLKHKFSMLFRK